jgi:ABC-type multidrug transport system ATPase subunit
VEIIQLQNVTKKYNDKVVLSELNQTFQSGQSVAFVGHNGCGKSTLLKIIAKLVSTTKGTVSYTEPLVFHYVPEKFVPVGLTVRSYLMEMGAMCDMTKEESAKCIAANTHDFFMEEFLDVKMKSLSKGTLQKVGVIQAIMKKPDVLLLDEPLSGQDAESQKVFISKINQLSEQNVTIFMSCHEKRLVDAISENVYTIEHGKLKPFQSKTKRYYALILENEGGKDILNGMHKYGTYYKIIMEKENCDKELPLLLQQGWMLRGMYHEENN